MYKSKVAGLLAGGLMLAESIIPGMPNIPDRQPDFIVKQHPYMLRFGYDTTGDGYEDVGETYYHEPGGKFGDKIGIFWDRNGNHMYEFEKGEIYYLNPDSGKFERPKLPGETDI